MGDKPLMKNKILIVSLLSVSLSVLSYADISVKQIENMVIKIHQKRVGFNLDTLESTKDPFTEKKDTNTSTGILLDMNNDTRLSLHAIMINKAYINDEWKAVNDTILGYTVKYIGKRGVVLKNGNNIKKLFLHKKRDNFIKIEEK